MDSIEPDQENSRLARIGWYVLLGVSAVWLVAAAVIVDVEYYDGLSAICNSRFFLSWGDFYFFDRGPFMAWVEMPAEALKRRLAIEPLDLRLDHATTALLHVGYLLAVYRAIVSKFGRIWSALAVFASAVTSYVFFSYAPFVSHDLAPGALLLWMIIWSDEFAQSRRPAFWLLLVAAGTAAPLIKQTYGVFWIAILFAHGLPLIMRTDPANRSDRRALTWLVVGAAASGVLTWIVYGLVLRTWVPDTALWLRPYRNLQYLGHVYDGTDTVFPIWIYIRNLWAYGRLTTLLLIPGLALSLAGTRLQRRAGIAWVTVVVFIHLLPLREVRYFAFAAPLTAFIVAPAAIALGRYPVGRLLMASLLMFDLGGAAIEASRIRKPFYRHNELRALLEPIARAGTPRKPLFHNISMLTFVAPDQSPLAADRYHRIFHVGVLHIRLLYGYAADQVRIILPTQLASATGRSPDGSAFLFANEILAHGPSWVPAPPIGARAFVQGLATLQTMAVQYRPDGAYQTALGHDEQSRLLTPVAMLKAGGFWPMQRRPDGSLVVMERDPSKAPIDPEPTAIRAFVVQRLSTLPPEARGTR